MAIFIYNAIADQMMGLDWTGFKHLCDVYDIEEIKDFTEYIIMIKSITSNFDSIYDTRINTKGVDEVADRLKSMGLKVKGKK